MSLKRDLNQIFPGNSENVVETLFPYLTSHEVPAEDMPILCVRALPDVPVNIPQIAASLGAVSHNIGGLNCCFQFDSYSELENARTTRCDINAPSTKNTLHFLCIDMQCLHFVFSQEICSKYTVHSWSRCPTGGGSVRCPLCCTKSCSGNKTYHIL